ncbi:hypothetical protein ABC347_03665 [Sphingomonas sp. 1P06PA]|uniref:hypothetical protein n=1 Tax=Sphingomonas sp. 1P06PA TaxID=554121 RepID=UPI0039A71D94
MIEAVRLMLMIGPIVPLPAPRLVIEAVEKVEITTASGGPSGFQITLAIDRRSELNTLLLLATGGAVSPATPPLRVLILAMMGGAPVPLFDGVMAHAEVVAGSPGEPGRIVITGDDLSAVMDRVDFSGLPYPAMPIPARVALICARYAAFGIVPLPIPPLLPDVPVPVDRVPAHKGTDLGYLQQLARDCGYVFYIEPTPVPATSVAYFGPELKLGIPQPALNVDMDSLTNVEELRLRFDPSRGVLPIVYIQNQTTRAPIPLPVPALNPLQPPLGLLPTPVARVTPLPDTAGLSPAEAIMAGIAAASRSQDAAEAEGSLDVLRYGQPLRARGLVGLRGVGIAYDGLWFVASVTTTLTRGSFRQNFRLTRNGLIPTVDRVAA